MKSLKVPLAVLVLTLVTALPASAVTPTAKLKAQLSAQKLKTAKVRAQLAKVKKTDATTIAGLKAQIATLTGQVATVTGQLAAANTASAASIATLNGQVAGLTAQVTAQAQGGVAAVLAASPLDQWNAIVAIWQVFPMLPPAGFCGFDKRNSFFGGTGLNIATYTFEDDTNC